MAVKRIVPDIQTEDPGQADPFYGRVLGLKKFMDGGFIQTWAAPGRDGVQVSFAREGGSGTPVPDLSVEVDDLDAVLSRVKAEGFDVVYGPVTEPWGVRRFFTRDPFGRLLNILSHDT